MTDKKRFEKNAVVLRVAAAGDQLRLIAMINTAFSIEKFVDGTRTDEERLAATMEAGEILLAEDGEGRLLGSIYMERKGKRGYLGMLAVDPAHQGRGLGQLLLRAGEERFRSEGMEAVDIIVLNLRPELLPIYERFGYEVTGTREFKTSRPLRPGYECHGVTMTKRL